MSLVIFEMNSSCTSNSPPPGDITQVKITFTARHFVYFTVG